MAMEAKERRDRRSAEGAVRENQAVVSEAKGPLVVNEELEKRLNRGDFAERGIFSSEDEQEVRDYWRIDEDDEQRFANPEAEAEFQRYLEEQRAKIKMESALDQTDREMRRPEIKRTSQRIKHIRG